MPSTINSSRRKDGEGFTRLSVLVHPRLGPVDPEAVLDAFRNILEALRPAPIKLWAEAGTVRVRRQAPILTQAGKLVPLLHLAGTIDPGGD